MTHRDIVAAHYAAGARGDLAGMLADFAPDISWTEAAGFPLAGTYTGPDEIRDRVLAVLNAEWDGFGMRVDELVGETGTVIAVGRYVGTHRRTGRPLDARAAHIWRLDGDRIVGFEQITDTRLVALAAGVGDAEDPA
ncbi:nuclear transport factor 2 family protein [Leucobacter sp. HNU]|uniref:nuclear transport factor 2 family protein n=1 Tax=Leucobacter sp. HNU TaxID=3236805 RepID=UPI003A80E310